MVLWEKVHGRMTQLLKIQDPQYFHVLHTTLFVLPTISIAEPSTYSLIVPSDPHTVQESQLSSSEAFQRQAPVFTSPVIYNDRHTLQ